MAEDEVRTMGDIGYPTTRGRTESRPEPGFVSLPGFPFPVESSNGVEQQARQVARRCARAYQLLRGGVELAPVFTLRVLSGDDWDSPSLPYGMPHFISSARELVVAGEPADFWRGFVPLLQQAPTSVYAEVVEVYGANPDLSPFFNLLVVHELGHAFHQPGASARWLDETFANICLHACVAATEPDALPLLETFPRAMTSLRPAQFEHVSLADFERLYSRMHPLNYGWYQCHFHTIAKLFHDSRGLDGLQRLRSRLRSSNELVLPDCQLARGLSRDADLELTNTLVAWTER